ncbi:MAG: TatD family hydrolase, partial [Planctomycetaceae bacterium]|nr:TatD family hydrolase [Planctomycetaceae bacterium]
MMPPTPSFGALVDTHAHLEDRRLQEDIEGVIERARAAGLVQIIAIGTTAADSAAVIEIASSHHGIFAAVGVQPNHVAEAEPDDWSRIVKLAAGPRVVAIGETGLDRYWDRTPFADQQEWFDRHLTLAHDCMLPVVIHCRNCEADVIEQLG